MVSSNTRLIVLWAFRWNKLDEREISSLYFGPIESAMPLIFLEITTLTAASNRNICLIFCCCLSFGCFPCLFGVALPILNAAWKKNIQNILNKNQEIFESNGFTCQFVQVIERNNQYTHLEF